MRTVRPACGTYSIHFLNTSREARLEQRVRL